MLPQFPDFKCLEWIDKEDTEQLTTGFSPYSDFNFTSMYAWNIGNKMRIAEHHGNLMVLFTDYITGKPFLSFIGNNKVSETARALLEYSEKHLNAYTLKLVPETVAASLCTKEFVVTPDRDAFDYLYSVHDLSNLHLLPHNKSNATRLAKIFVNSNPNHQRVSSKLSMVDIDALWKLYNLWAENKAASYIPTNECQAFDRLLQTVPESVNALLLYVNGEIKGFLLFEISGEYAIAHFCKADISYNGIYDALMWFTGKTLLSMGIQYLNFEQDLGLMNLRRAKEKYTVHDFLKKYTIQKSQ